MGMLLTQHSWKFTDCRTVFKGGFMFFLETKDGERFFTDKDTDDTKEFGRIIESKMGRDASELYDNLVTEHEDRAQELLNRFAYRYNECIQKFDTVLNTKPVDSLKLEEILCELQSIYLDYLR